MLLNQFSQPKNFLPRANLAMLIRRDPTTGELLPDSIGLSTVSGTWPNSIVQAIPGGPLENFGPFIGGAQVLFSTLPQDISNQFFWGYRGYAYYSLAQSITTVKRILDYLMSDAYVDYLYIGSDQLFVGGEPVAAIFGATL